MLCIVNIDFQKKRSPLSSLICYMFPKIERKSVAAGDKSFFTYRLSLLPFNMRTKEKYFRILLRSLIKDGVTLVTGVPPAWAERLLIYGIKTPDLRRYLRHRVFDFVHTAAQELLPDCSGVCICEKSRDGLTRMLAEFSLEIFSSVTVITECPPLYDDFRDEMLNKTGGAVNVSDISDFPQECSLYIVLGGLKDILPLLRGITKKAVLSLDGDYSPAGYLPCNIITVYYSGLQENLAELRPKGVSLPELSSAFFFEDIKDGNGITEFESFGRSVTAEALRERLRS